MASDGFDGFCKKINFQSIRTGEARSGPEVAARPTFATIRQFNFFIPCSKR